MREINRKFEKKILKENKGEKQKKGEKNKRKENKIKTNSNSMCFS